jgi:hypothetical protein
MFYKQYPRNCTMFNKEYPKSCTMFNISFENSQADYLTSPDIIAGCGDWVDKKSSGVFVTVEIKRYILLEQATLGFRGSIYVL